MIRECLLRRDSRYARSALYNQKEKLPKEMTKYNAFFESIKSFTIKNGISVEAEFVGAEDKEVIKLENQIGFNFGLGMRTYLEHFGNKIGIRNFDITRFTIKDILQAEDKAVKLDIREKIINGDLVDGWDEKSIYNSLEQICFVNYFETNHYFTFISRNDENTNLYGWDGGKESYKHEMSITSSLRSQIFIGLKRICDVRREKHVKELVDYRLDFYNRTKEINIENLKWLDIFKENYIDNNLYILSKYRFDKEVSLIESNENRIVEIEEYGQGFEKMIRKKAI